MSTKISFMFLFMFLFFVGFNFAMNSYVLPKQLSETNRQPSSSKSKLDIFESLNNLSNKLDDTNSFTPKSCSQELQRFNTPLSSANYTDFDLNKAIQESDKIFARSWDLKKQIALKVREFFLAKQINKSSDTCISESRETLRILRNLEDQLILNILKPKEFVADQDPKAGLAFRGKAIEVLQDERKPVKLRSGDLILSRGNAFTSAAIARIGVDEAQFSHLSQVYINAPVGTELTIEEAEKDPRVMTIEAHIEIGSFVRSFKKYLEDGNARLVQYRYRGSAENSHKAAKSIYDYVKKYQETQRKKTLFQTESVNNNPPYDFKMDISNSEEIFCAEIIKMAYAHINIKLPSFPTLLKKII